MKLLMLTLLLLFSSSSAADPAIKILCDHGFSHSVAKVKTTYANVGDHIFYKEQKASNGMLLITDGKVDKFKEGEGNRVVVAVVKNYS
jgi:hypothetical protein